MLAGMAVVLRGLAQASHGSCVVARDPDHVVEMLELAPAGWRVILHWPGYASHPQARTGMAMTRVTAIIQRAEGLSAPGGELEDRGALPAMTRLIEDVSQWVRALRFPTDRNTDAAGFSLTGSAWISVEPSKKVTAHQVDFEMAVALPPFMVAGEPVALNVMID